MPTLNSLLALAALAPLALGAPVRKPHETSTHHAADSHHNVHHKRAVTVADGLASLNSLQNWYNEATGLWNPSTGWWNSANCMTTIANLALAAPATQSAAETVFANTFAKASDSSMDMVKVVSHSFLTTTYYVDGSNVSDAEVPAGVNRAMATKTEQFLDGFYDDEGWWALAWIAAYDVSGNQQYLSEAESIFSDMQQTFGQTPCANNSGGTGGIWWDKQHTYVNAIANELFLSVAAHLANRVSGDQRSSYLKQAQQQWSWFQGSGMIGSNNLIADGLTSSCQSNDGTAWSYNQGVVLGGLVELSRATGDQHYIQSAEKIADAAMSSLAPQGILHDPCEPDCGLDGGQFKGIFMRNLQALYQVDRQSRYEIFIQDNAASILAHDAQDNQLSLVWSGPWVSPANASTQSSAMDAVVASLAI